MKYIHLCRKLGICYESDHTSEKYVTEFLHAEKDEPIDI